MSWFWLFIAGLFEVAFASTLERAEALKDLRWGAASIVCLGLSIAFLYVSLRHIPLPIAYAVWTAIGAAGTTMVYLWVFNERLSLIRSIGLILVVGGTLLLFLSKQKTGHG